MQLQEKRVPLLVEFLLGGRLDALITSYPTELPEAADHPAARARSNQWQSLAS